MKKILKNTTSVILFLCTTILTFLLTGEAIVRLFYPLISNYDLEMFRYAAYGKMSSDNPSLSHKHRPGVYFKKLYGVEVKINSKGLRDYEYSYAKPKDCYRILVLGDSITFGWGVPFAMTYPKLLEKELNKISDGIKYEIINAGVGNYQLKDEVSFLKDEGLRYNPDMIILGYFIDDAKVNPKVRYYNFKKRSYLYAFLASRWNALKFNLNPKLNFINYYSGLYADNTETLNNLKENIVELKSIVKTNNIPLLVIIIPELHTINNYFFKAIHKYVASNFGEIDGIKVIDLLPYFNKNVKPDTYWVSSEDKHHNSKAQKIIMEAIYPAVLELKGN